MPDEPREVILKPVTGKEEGVILLDMYENGEVSEENWIGSRRTLRQCELVLGLREGQK